MSNLFTALAILIWMGLGAAIAVGAMGVLTLRREDGQLLCPYGKLLGMPCWTNVDGDYVKHRVVAVSHKGAVAIREWDDDSGKNAKWVRKELVKQGCIRFGEDPYGTGEVVA